MTYYLNEIRSDEKEKNRKNAVGKARADVNQVFENAGLSPCVLNADEAGRSEAGFWKKLLWHHTTVRALRARFARLQKGDSIYLQFPILSHSIFTGSCFHNLAQRGVRTVLLVHDLDMLRMARASKSFLQKMRIWLEETQTLRRCTQIIVHNGAMKAQLAEMGINAEKMIPLGLFDYLLPTETGFDQSRFRKDGGVVIAGNLSKEKCAYLSELPDDVCWNLYGVGFEDDGRQNVTYKGSFSPEELVLHLDGGFGLVWDGTSAETCTGAYGEYLRINNPHKTSLYLAAGLPVIIWKEAALAPFVEENHVGLTVSSLYEIRDAINILSDDEYQIMKENAKQIGRRLREGQYTLAALSKVRERMRDVLSS